MPPRFNLLLVLSALDVLLLLAILGQAAWRDPLWWFRPPVRNVFAWIIAILLGIQQLGFAWMISGHVTCDFAAQWMMGRMYQKLEAQDLYLVGPGRETLSDGYVGKECEEMDRDILQKSTRAFHDGIEGPLYPPTHGLFMAPFGILPPKAAHTAVTFVYVQLAFVIGWLVRVMTRGRLGMGEGALIVFAFPNTYGGVVLGQNCILTMAILAGGWALWARGRPFLGGMVWGLLAYKPVFGLAVGWVPLVLLAEELIAGRTRHVGNPLPRWAGLRMLTGLAVGGFTFCALTLPFCGIEPWKRWVIVGQSAAETYSRDRNWVWMSRDLVGLPRRAMWDWEHATAHVEYVLGLREWDDKVLQAVLRPEKVEPLRSVTGEPDQQPMDIYTKIGFWLLGGVGGLTVLVYLAAAAIRRLRRLPFEDAVIGPRPAFLLYGALLTTFHFMHYDMLAFALPTVLFLAKADRLGKFGRCLLFAICLGLVACAIDIASGLGSLRIPFETFLVAILWGWTGLLTIAESFTPRKKLAGMESRLDWREDGDDNRE